jgi:putative flippase GtrA
MKKQDGIIQFIKFAVVGVSNTAVDWIIYYGLSRLVFTAEDQKSFAKLISFVVAVLNSYLWNTIWTFKSEYQKSLGKSSAVSQKGIIFVRFFVVSVIGWGINYLVFKYALSVYPKPDIIALIFASGAAVIWNFFANKFWTYKK